MYDSKSGLPKVVSHNEVPVRKTRTQLKRRNSLTRCKDDLSAVDLPLMMNVNKKTTYISLGSKQPETKIKADSRRRTKKRSLKKILSFIGVSAMIIVAVYCASCINLWQYENKNSAEQMAGVRDLLVDRTDDSGDISILEDIGECDGVPHRNEIETEPNFVGVDFAKLKEINSDTKAYIKMNNLDVDMPVVQTTNNDFYLTHSFDRTKNSAGWVFGDFRNDWNDLKANTIIYGHNRKNYAMFGSLKRIFEKKWYENVDNHKVYISTEDKNMVFQIFSAYTIPTETYYLKNEFSSVEEHEMFLNTLTSRSRIDFGIRPTVKDKILTLSTCHTSDAKTVIHAVLIDIQEKRY